MVQRNQVQPWPCLNYQGITTRSICLDIKTEQIYPAVQSQISSGRSLNPDQECFKELILSFIRKHLFSFIFMYNNSISRACHKGRQIKCRKPQSYYLM